MKEEEKIIHTVSRLVNRALFARDPRFRPTWPFRGSGCSLLRKAEIVCRRQVHCTARYARVY